MGIVLVLLGFAYPLSAQTTTDDAAARERFELGRAAFEQTDFEEALVHFREAYRLSRRGQLQYNIGTTADRLQRDEEALEAFQRYLAETANPTRDQEVRARMATLRDSIEERKQRERALVEAAAVRYESAVAEDPTERRVPKSAIIGGSILAAAGVAGVATLGVGLARHDQCLERDTNGACLTEQARSPWSAVYGAVGIAALAGSVTWLVVSSRRSKDKNRATAWRLTPTGVMVSGSF